MFRIDPSVTKEFRRLDDKAAEKAVALAQQMHAAKVTRLADKGLTKIVVRFDSKEMLRNIEHADRLEREVRKLKGRSSNEGSNRSL